MLEVCGNVFRVFQKRLPSWTGGAGCVIACTWRGFGGFRKVLGQFSFASDWTLQAKAAPRVIKDGGSA